MKKYLSLSIAGLLCTFNSVAQQNTEVYVADLNFANDTIEVDKLLNISNNDGYDNQPSFFDDENILFSSTRNGQTDIARYNIQTKSFSWISDTPKGSEYSPLIIPGKAAISAIRLDKDGLQRLYQYDFNTGQSEELLQGLKVGYHVWYNDYIMVCTVLIENRMDLVVTNLNDNSRYTFQKNVGRSLHKIPDSELISFVSKENDTAIVRSMHPISGATENIVNLLTKSEDVTWTQDGTLLSGYENILIGYHPKKDNRWKPLYKFDPKQISSISRLAISPNGKRIALVSTDSPDKLVQKQVEAYNSGNLDAFVNCYSENVVVSNFPSDTLYVGHEKLRKNYGNLTPENKIYDVEVVNRIVIDDHVIDYEKVTGRGKTTMQVAIYEVGNAILNMTFIFEDSGVTNPEAVVQKQLEAYNSRDIDTFLATYSNDAKLYGYPHTLETEGSEAIRTGYSKFFESNPDLHCEIKNRIVIGNKVIDEEEITSSGNTFNAVVIYEVENEKIAKVTFVR